VAEYGRSIFLFRRDLRISDNTGLIKASKASNTVVPSFVFDPRQGARNPYFSPNAFHFMIESLDDLARQVAAARGRLCIFRGIPEVIVDRIVAEEDIEAVFTNEDYTPFSRTRDAAIAKACQKKGVEFHSYPDVLLHKPTDVLKDDKKPYTIFSHFLRKARSIPVRTVNAAAVDNLSHSRIPSDQHEMLDDALKPPSGQKTDFHGGRQQALEILAAMPLRLQMLNDEPVTNN
jgi:deoxyribodipyrimidine photo-lyase